jgi:hypothetical protein
LQSLSIAQSTQQRVTGSQTWFPQSLRQRHPVPPPDPPIEPAAPPVPPPAPPFPALPPVAPPSGMVPGSTDFSDPPQPTAGKNQTMPAKILPSE